MLALWFPFLSADRLVRTPSSPSAAQDDAPLVLVEKQRGALRLVALDPRACALGLVPGMPLADARAQVPQLVAVDHDPGADRRWLERIADLCDRYTPLVTIDGSDGLTLDITGCAHLFGGEAALLADLKQRLARFTGHLHHGFASTPEGAQALARFRDMRAMHRDDSSEQDAIRALPVAALRLHGDILVALRRAGLKTIGDLADRPSAPLSARFGEEATALLVRLLGRADSRIVPRRAPAALLFERRFAEPIARTQDALDVIGALAEEAAQVLEERRQGGRRFAARLFRSDGLVRDVHVECALPSRDAAMLVRLFRERVDALSDPLDPGFGFDMIRFAVPVVEALAPGQLQLDGGTISADAMTALVDRLSTRLGRGRIRRFLPQDSHEPEQGVLTLPALDVPVPVAWDAPEAGEPPTRPIHLFDPPQRIDVIAEVPDGPPHRFRWQRALHDVARYEGPERIAAQWWKYDGAPGLTRDYYRVEDVRGRRFWIFRHGLYGQERDDPAWYVHGLFA